MSVACGSPTYTRHTCVVSHLHQAYAFLLWQAVVEHHVLLQSAEARLTYGDYSISDVGTTLAVKEQCLIPKA